MYLIPRGVTTVLLISNSEPIALAHVIALSEYPILIMEVINVALHVITLKCSRANEKDGIQIGVEKYISKPCKDWRSREAHDTVPV